MVSLFFVFGVLAVQCHAAAEMDWLTATASFPTTLVPVGSSLHLSNGLIKRIFTTTPAFGTTDFLLNATDDRGGEQSLLRAIKPEAHVVLDGVQYNIGGLGQASSFLAYCNRSDLKLTADAAAFQFTSFSVSSPVAPFPWIPGERGSPKELKWPPSGVNLAVHFRAPASAPPAHRNVTVTLYYEMYDDIPLLAKWMNVSTVGGTAQVTAAVVEMFGANARFGPYISHGSFAPGNAYNGAPGESGVTTSPLLFAMTDQAHGAACAWGDDAPGSSGAVEPVLSCTYASGPGVHVVAGSPFLSFRVLELVSDDTDVERQSLGRHRVTQTLAPHTTENPIFFHATDVGALGFKATIDQMAEVGFEMLIYSFGSGFVLETADQAYLNHIKDQISYAKSKGIEVGGYDLICLQRGHGGYGGNVGDQWDCTDDAGHPKEDACFASGWYDKLFGLVSHFINYTGLSMLETDGPYGGTTCASASHAYHVGESDSVYQQTRKQSEFYAYMRSLGMYINQPDNYFYAGGSRTGMGYDENQYSLPRWQDLTVSRMGMYDDLYVHLPTQGWMFVPIQDYHGGGPDAAFAPLSQHLVEYEWALAQYLGAGVAACYRGDRPYDTNATRDVVRKWISFYRAHRETLLMPIVHLRRATLQGWDGWLHVNPRAYGGRGEVGVAMLFNPTDDVLDVTVSLPLYYTGLDDTATISVDGGAAQTLRLDRAYRVGLALTMGARSIHTVVVGRP